MIGYACDKIDTTVSIHEINDMSTKHNFQQQQNKRCNFRACGMLLAAFVAGLSLLAFPSSSYADGGFPFIGVLHAGQHPEGIAVDTQTHMVYIAYEYPGLVVCFDPVRGSVRWKAPLTDSATDIQVDSTTHRVYAASSIFRNRSGLLSVFDGATGKVLLTATTGFGDNGLAIDTKRQRVYVSSSDSGVVNAFTLLPAAAGRFIVESATLKIGPHPQAIGVNSRLGRLYVGDISDDTMRVYDEDSGRIVSTMRVGDLPVQPVRVDEASGRVYVVCSDGQELDVIDGNTNKVIARVPSKPYPEGVAFNTATGRIYVTNEGQRDTGGGNKVVNSTITVIDGQTFDVLGTLNVGRSPDGVEADPQLRRVYISLEGSDAVLEVSDSVNLPLIPNANLHQAIVSRQTLSALQQATIATVVLMLLTIGGATLAALSQRRHAQENLQTPPTGALSR